MQVRLAQRDLVRQCLINDKQLERVRTLSVHVCVCDCLFVLWWDRQLRLCASMTETQRHYHPASMRRRKTVARLDDAAPFLPHRPARRPPNGPDPPTCPRLCMCRRERLCLCLRLCLHLCLHLRLCLHLHLCLHRRAQCPAVAAGGHGAAGSVRPPWASMPWSVLFQAAQAPLFHSLSPYVGISLSLSLCVCVCLCASMWADPSSGGGGASARCGRAAGCGRGHAGQLCALGTGAVGDGGGALGRPAPRRAATADCIGRPHRRRRPAPPRRRLIPGRHTHKRCTYID
jgi:hypothetical protein